MEPGWNDKRMLRYINIAIFNEFSVTYLQDLNSQAFEPKTVSAFHSVKKERLKFNYCFLCFKAKARMF